MLYEYKCSKCYHQFELILTYENRKVPLTKACPECKQEGTVYRFYSIAGVIDPGILNADKNMEKSGVQSALERIRDHAGRKMNWKG